MKIYYSFVLLLLLFSKLAFSQNTVWGENNSRTETRQDAGLQGNAGAISGFYQTEQPINFPEGAQSWWHLLDVRHSNPENNFAMQFAGSFFDQELYFRKTNDNASQPWAKVLLENNGKVGLGLANPSAKLHLLNRLDNSNSTALKLFYEDTWGTADYASSFRFLDIASSEGGNIMQVNGYGIGIGCDPPPYDSQDKLYVNGNVGITGAGKLGIGTSSPRAYLDVSTNISNGSLGTILGRMEEGDSEGDGTFLGVRGYETQNSGYNGKSFALEHSFYGVVNSSLNFFRGSDRDGGYLTFNTNDNTEQMRITPEGNVALGTTDTKGYKLAINGNAIANSVTVKATASWPDYVFEKGYQLAPLADVKKYIDRNGHLPGIPCAAEIKDKGQNLGELNMQLTKKIEELTLYIIELKNEVQELKRDSENSKKANTKNIK